MHTHRQPDRRIGPSKAFQFAGKMLKVKLKSLHRNRQHVVWGAHMRVHVCVYAHACTCLEAFLPKQGAINWKSVLDVEMTN